MRALFTTQPGTGHLTPLLPVADALAARGHEVRFAASASFAPEIAAAGHECVAVGRDWLTVDMPRHFPEIAAVPPGSARYAVGRTVVFAGRTADEALDDLVELGRRWRPDVVVREAAEYGGHLAAEVLGVPHAVVRTDSGSSSYAERHVVAGALDSLRAERGLPADPDGVAPFHYLQLSTAPPAFDEPPAVAAPTRHQVRPDGATATPSAAGGVRGDRPVVYATLGTVYSQPSLLGAILEGLADEPLELIVTVGPHQDPARFGPQPPNVRVVSWIPQAEVLARCDAVVTHGGYGTVSAAMTAGVPMVFLPISADQPINARRGHELGVGVVLGPDERTPERIRAAVRTVLDDPSHRAAAQRVRDHARRAPPVDHAVDLLVELARSRAPLPTASCGPCRSTQGPLAGGGPRDDGGDALLPGGRT